ncbi:MAG: hypothetical protein ABJK28_14485 [Algibacter sp.]
MKKNTFLYILLFFLIIVNCFFLYNYLGKDDVKKGGRQGGNPMGFIIKQLKFDDSQTELMEALNKKHHHKMMRIGDQTRDLKDALFNRLSDVSITDKYIDSITNLIGRNVAESDREVFRHFRGIEDICTGKQKEKFKSIIKEAIGKGTRKENGELGEGGEGHRPPPRDGDRMGPGPPLDGGGMPPPPNH